MLTTAAWPEASRKWRPSEETIQQPSPREAIGKVFLKLRGKSPLLVGMRCPGKDCSRVENSVSAMGTNLSHGAARLRCEPDYWNRKRNVTSSVVLQGGSARPDSASGITIHCVSREMKRD